MTSHKDALDVSIDCSTSIGTDYQFLEATCGGMRPAHWTVCLA